MREMCFFFSFMALSVVSSLAVFGWYIVTRGEWFLTPDGRWKKRGMLFMYWSLFFEQYRQVERVYFSGEQLDKKIDLLEKVRPDIGERVYMTADQLSLYQLTGDIPSDHDLAIIADIFGERCKVETGVKTFRVFVEEPVYHLPEWIQKPFSSCPTCMAGPYGTAIWMIFLYLQRDAFAWTSHIIFAQIAFGILFLLTLSCLNTFVSKKIQV